MKKLNWNDEIKVKLTDYGKDIFYHQYDDLIKAGYNIKQEYPKVDINGLSIFQLHHFMNLYGKHINPCDKNVVEDISFYIEEEGLSQMSNYDAFVDYIYEIIKLECKGLDSIYEDYIHRVVGEKGFNALYANNFIESCGVVNGRRLWVLCEKEK